MKNLILSALKKTMPLNLNKTKPGFTLTEAMVVVALAIGAAAAAFGTYYYLRSSTRQNQTYEAISMLSMAIERIYNSQGNFLGLNNAVLLSSESLPRNLVRGNALVAPLGGPITVAPVSNGNKFSIALGELDKAGCIFMATNQIEAWSSVAINGSNINKNAAVAAATSNCSADGNTVTFVPR